MSKQHFVLIALLIVATSFILIEFRNGVVPTVDGKTLTALSAKATMKGRFQLSDVKIRGSKDADIEFMVIGKRDGVDGWGESLFGLSQADRKLLGETNIRIISDTCHELRKGGISWMNKEPPVTLFEDTHGNFFIHGKIGDGQRHAANLVKRKNFWKEAGDGWKIYR